MLRKSSSAACGFRAGELLEGVGDRGVIRGGECEGRLGETPAGFAGERAAVGVELFGERGVVGGRCNDGDVFKILRRGAHHRWAANVDVLDDLGEGGAGTRGGLFEGVEIDDHHVDRLNAVALDGSAMLGVFADVEDAAVDFGVESLDAAIEHLRKAGELGDVADFKASFTKCTRGAAG